MANCIGFRNYKFFFLFLVYASVACDLATGCMGQTLARSLFGTGLNEVTPGQMFFLGEGLSISGLFVLLLNPFLAFHCFLTSKNMSTIEFCEGKEASKTGIWDLGLFRNLQQVLGQNPLTWFLPVGGPIGDGITFPVSERYLEKVEEDRRKQELALEAANVDDRTALLEVVQLRAEGGVRSKARVSEPVASETSTWGWTSRQCGVIFSWCENVNNFRDRCILGAVNIFSKGSPVSEPSEGPEAEHQVYVASPVSRLPDAAA